MILVYKATLPDGFYVVAYGSAVEGPFESRSDARRAGNKRHGLWDIGQCTSGVLTVVRP